MRRRRPSTACRAGKRTWRTCHLTRQCAILRLRKLLIWRMMSATQLGGARRIGVHAGHDSYKWWALSCTSLGMLLATINSGTLIIALPDLERSLHTGLLELVWV